MVHFHQGVDRAGEKGGESPGEQQSQCLSSFGAGNTLRVRVGGRGRRAGLFRGRCRH